MQTDPISDLLTRIRNGAKARHARVDIPTSRLKGVYKPGSRRYVGSVEIRPVVGGMGISIMTTPKGVMTGRAARKAHIGGEVLCEVW